MIIRIDSLENLISDTAYYLGTAEDDLLRAIKKIDFRSGDDAGYQYIAHNKKHILEEVYLCHVARRLNTDNHMVLLPLREVLTTPNPFSSFLADHQISFEKSLQGIDVLVYRGKHIEWWKSTNVGFNPARFKSRLTKDFCINGFQFLYDITNSAQPDYNLYSYAPEFLQDLDYLLGTQLVNDFRAESQTFVALCRVPKEKIVFDYNADDGRFEERYIYSALSYIWEYCYSKNEQVRKGYNCMLRALDDYTVHIERWVLEEEIECQR